MVFQQRKKFKDLPRNAALKILNFNQGEDVIQHPMKPMRVVNVQF